MAQTQGYVQAYSPYNGDPVYNQPLIAQRFVYGKTAAELGIKRDDLHESMVNAVAMIQCFDPALPVDGSDALRRGRVRASLYTSINSQFPEVWDNDAMEFVSSLGDAGHSTSVEKGLAGMIFPTMSALYRDHYVPEIIRTKGVSGYVDTLTDVSGELLAGYLQKYDLSIPEIADFFRLGDSSLLFVTDNMPSLRNLNHFFPRVELLISALRRSGHESVVPAFIEYIRTFAGKRYQQTQEMVKAVCQGVDLRSRSFRQAEDDRSLSLTGLLFTSGIIELTPQVMLESTAKLNFDRLIDALNYFEAEGKTE